MSKIANLSTAFSLPSQTTTFTSSTTSTTFPVVLGVTAAGQPLIQNLVTSFLPAITTKIEQPQPLQSQSNGKLILVLSGILANGKPIVQGIISKEEINNSFFNENSISESENISFKKATAADSTITPTHSEASGADIYVTIQGGITKQGVPLIQGVTLIPGTFFSETLQTTTPPPSLSGEGDNNYYFEKSSKNEESFLSSVQKPTAPEHRPLFNNQSLPDFQSDNIEKEQEEEECTLIQAQEQGVCCNDEFSHKLLPQQQQEKNLLTNNKSIFLRSSPIDDTKLSKTLSYILSNLAKLKMVNQSQYSDIVERLYELEDEMKGAATGLPPDPSLTDLIGKILSAEYPNADLQIIVSSSRKTTTTKSFYETETPGMVGLEPEKLQELQRKLMTNISEAKLYFVV
jgi:hypothetical protein